MQGAKLDARSKQSQSYKIRLTEHYNFLSTNAKKRKRKLNKNSLALTVYRYIYQMQEIVTPYLISRQIIHLKPSLSLLRYQQ